MSYDDPAYIIRGKNDKIKNAICMVCKKEASAIPLCANCMKKFKDYKLLFAYNKNDSSKEIFYTGIYIATKTESIKQIDVINKKNSILKMLNF